MSAIADPTRQFDLFVPFVADLPLRDQRETMERPFFSLSKNKRLKSIGYTSPDGKVYVHVSANPEFGMATIWDADILIWAASMLCELKKRRANEIPRTLSFQPYELLKTIQRDTGGRQYKLLRESLARLQATTIRTNIRADKARRKERQFSWIESFTDVVDDQTQTSKGMSITLSDWFYEGVVMDGGVLSIDPLYFTISGGRERWLYRVARKHAGGAGEEGFAIGVPTLFEKSGAEGDYRRFKFEMAKIVRANDIPGFHLCLEEKDQGEPVLRMVRRELLPSDGIMPAVMKPRAGRAPRKAEPSKTHKTEPAALPLFARTLSDEMLARVRKDFPRWDVYALKSEYDRWLDADAQRAPKSYDAAFYGFVRSHTARNPI
jgi:plasmid replication initiation protein